MGRHGLGVMERVDESRMGDRPVNKVSRIASRRSFSFCRLPTRATVGEAAVIDMPVISMVLSFEILDVSFQYCLPS